MSKPEKPKFKRHFAHKNISKYNFNLEVGLKGFLCSCNSREKDCIKESYNILNKYSDILWPAAPDTDTENCTKQEEIEEELKNEIASLKSGVKRFQHINSGAKNIIFIKTTLEEPLKLAETILIDISQKKTQETKFLIRLVPIEITCKSYLADIQTAFEQLYDKHFSSAVKTFSIIFNHRNNDSLTRDGVIETIANVVAKKDKENNIEHKVDLKNAEISIVVEVIRRFTFLSVIPNYLKYKKYNLLAFCDRLVAEDNK